MFWIGNDPRNTTHQYNGCCCVAAISLWETFRMLLASGFSAEVGHLRRDLLFWNPANHRNIRIAAKTEMKSYIEPLHGHLPPPLFTSFNTFPGHHCHQQSVSVWRSIQKRVWTVLFSRFTCGNGLWLRAISAHDLPTPRTDPSRRTASLLGKQRLANAYLESKRCTSIYLPFNTVGLNLHGFQNELMSIWTGPGWLLRYPPIDDSS